jgi:hypothetical protein
MLLRPEFSGSEHDPEKWTGFRKRSCSNKKIEQDGDSKNSHPGLRRHQIDPR